MIGVFFSAYVLLCAEYDCSTATLGWYLQEVSETCVDLRCLEDLLEQCILQHWMSPSELSIPSTAPHSSSQPASMPSTWSPPIYPIWRASNEHSTQQVTRSLARTSYGCRNQGDFDYCNFKSYDVGKTYAIKASDVIWLMQSIKRSILLSCVFREAEGVLAI
jgi:hypothetical protein